MSLCDTNGLPPRLYERREAMGELELNIATRHGRSVAATQAHRGAMRVLRPHYLDRSGQVCYTTVNPGGGYLGGDEYRIRVTVDEGAALLLTSQAATKVYRTPGDRVLQETEVVLGPGAVFEYLPDQLIMYQGATYAQHMNVAMHPTASFLATEVVTPGWAPDGSRFMYDEVRVRTAVNVAGRLAVVDNLLVRPGGVEFVRDFLLFFEDKTHLATLLAVDARIDQGVLDEVRSVMATFAAERARTEILHAVTLVSGPGLAIRALGTHTDDLTGLLTAVADHLRHAWRGQGPLHLRKY